MGKIVNVVLNSNNKVSGANNDAIFFVDWGSILKDRQPYYLHWSYASQPANTITAATKLAQVQVDFNTRSYLNRSSTIGAPSTQYIGCLRTFFVNGTINYLFADDNNNPPIYLDARPQNNTFRVQVLTNDATPVAWTDNTAAPIANSNYILTLSFQECDEGDY
jgi:hypothetical protein